MISQDVHVRASAEVQVIESAVLLCNVDYLELQINITFNVYVYTLLYILVVEVDHIHVPYSTETMQTQLIKYFMFVISM